MKEVILANQHKINSSDVLQRLTLSAQKYFVISAHREENIQDDEHFNALMQTLDLIAKQYQLPVIVSTHPRTQKRIKEKQITIDARVQFLKPLGFSDYIALQKNALAVLSDSGTINEETSILGLKALNIRDAHERPEAMEEATTMMVGLQSQKVLLGLSLLLNQTQDAIQEVEDYAITNVSDKVIRIMLSYFNYSIPKK
jgi:UDP-N-acetylglucosamine 2-epimerase (non-hydrolysing)